MERIDCVEMIGRVGGIKTNPLGEKLKAVADTMRDNSGDIQSRLTEIKYAKENNNEADLFLGIESEINDLLGRWMITNIAVIEDNKKFESYGTSPSFPVPDNLVQKVLDTNLSEAMDTVLGEDKERHNHSGGIQLLTHNEISRIDLTEYAFIMALTKYVNGEKWR